MLRSLWKAVVAAMTSWHQGKLFIEHSLTISHDSLHIIVGVLLWLVFGLLLRRPLTVGRPWLCLFAVILWNETVDLWIEQWPDPGQQYGEGAKDLLLTMAVPTIIMVAARMRPDLFRGSGRTRRR
ncbi:MAG: hypothetical protein ACJ8FT_06665 [Sphingomonas sp.]